MGIPEGRERGKRTREIFDVIMAKNFPKLMTDLKTQIQVLRETPSRTTTTTYCKPRHIMLKLQKSKYKEKILKEGRVGGTLPIEEEEYELP